MTRETTPTVESVLEHTAPWLQDIDMSQIPEQAVLFNYQEKGKWKTEMCSPDFIRSKLIANAKARWMKQHTPTSFWKGDKLGKGIHLISCRCGVAFLGTKCIDYSCGTCLKHIHVQRESIHGAMNTVFHSGKMTKKRGSLDKE